VVVDLMAMVFWVLEGERESGDISHHHLLLEIRATASTVTGAAAIDASCTLLPRCWKHACMVIASVLSSIPLPSYHSQDLSISSSPFFCYMVLFRERTVFSSYNKSA
jgi:hypothetical protein